MLMISQLDAAGACTPSISRGALVVVAAEEQKKRTDSAVKRAQLSEDRRVYNRAHKSAVATRMKKVRLATPVRAVHEACHARAAQVPLHNLHEHVASAAVARRRHLSPRWHGWTSRGCDSRHGVARSNCEIHAHQLHCICQGQGCCNERHIPASKSGQQPVLPVCTSAADSISVACITA
jgi:ribosomal protein S20